MGDSQNNNAEWKGTKKGYIMQVHIYVKLRKIQTNL